MPDWKAALVSSGRRVWWFKGLRCYVKLLEDLWPASLLMMFNLLGSD